MRGGDRFVAFPDYAESPLHGLFFVVYRAEKGVVTRTFDDVDISYFACQREEFRGEFHKRYRYAGFLHYAVGIFGLFNRRMIEQFVRATRATY